MTLKRKEKMIGKYKNVKIEMIAEIDYEVPSDWNKDMIEFHLNGSGWCCDNIINELKKVSKRDGCICGITKFKYIKDIK